MDITEVKDKPYPQKVTLDSNIVTVTGELISSGKDISVLLCERPIVCMEEKRNYTNVEIFHNQEKMPQKKVFLNPQSQELFLDIHCTHKMYETVDELCQDRPRYFSCKKGFFAMANEDTVRIADGQEFELKNVQCIEKYLPETGDSDSCGQQHTNVNPVKTSNIIHCRCQSSGMDVQIPSSCRSSFQSLEDPNPYRTMELLDRFTLPRRVKIHDKNLHRSASMYLDPNQIILESATTNFFVLFTLDYTISEQASEIELKDNIKCCELVDPTAVKIKRRIDNSHIGERFDAVFLFESEQKGRPQFSLLGKKSSIPVSRLRSGREEYIAMDTSERVSYPIYPQQLSSCDSGFAEAEQESSPSRSLSLKTGSRDVPENDDCKRRSIQEDYINVVTKDETSSSRISGDYISISIDSDKAPPLPERLYTDSEHSEQPTAELSQIQSDSSKTDISEGKQTVAGHSTKEHDTNVKAAAKQDKPESELRCMPATELAELLKQCKLDRFADVCIDESVDGELFVELTDDILKDSPFQLNKFEILKVNKIKNGWKPK